MKRECPKNKYGHSFKKERIIERGKDSTGKFEIHLRKCKYCGEESRGKVYPEFLSHIFSI
ncbi:hypothetical protein IIA15_10555 [candidate division TA06 bacterium]|nr:hypothetical protein [candidate division TA06 bacterium]